MVNIPYYVLVAFILFLPSFVANPAAVLTKGKTKMDFGKNFSDGRRILGDGKSWGGFFGGSLIGAITGIVIYIPLSYASIFSSPFPGDTLEIIGIALSLSFGSLTGDALGSFIKRRLGMKSGHSAFLLDQWPFVLVSFLFLFLFYGAFFMQYYGNIIGAVTILIVTPPLHRAINVIGYRMNRKDVPW